MAVRKQSSLLNILIPQNGTQFINLILISIDDAHSVTSAAIHRSVILCCDPSSLYHAFNLHIQWKCERSVWNKTKQNKNCRCNSNTSNCAVLRYCDRRGNQTESSLYNRLCACAVCILLSISNSVMTRARHWRHSTQIYVNLVVCS